jgi:hypothetical protein
MPTDHEVEIQPQDKGFVYVCERCGRYVVIGRDGVPTVINAGDETANHRGATQGLTLHVDSPL